MSGAKFLHFSDSFYSMFKFFGCHSCESRNPLFAEAPDPGALDSCFRRNDRMFGRIRSKNLNIEF